ncbi:uncharacterized protein E0L32_011843 [Thyridium curvatum]|uniref:DASH complex subunit DUO1 n=1 Tax=Thyridium curvatum TaxID=1093900 RepID=A0A507BF26_9PEZI|nr:uncharacterized protein E0L32_011843 [Thyridium curvatum]TPX18073.1 hypothetical protein E0L32_011843 [Thyridium curvatum]
MCWCTGTQSWTSTQAGFELCGAKKGPLDVRSVLASNIAAQIPQFPYTTTRPLQQQIHDTLSPAMDSSDLFTSSPAKADPASDSEDGPKTPTNQNVRFDAEEVREAALRRELEGVRNINEVIEGVLGTLERAKGNMNNVSQTVNNASTLLNTWTRILSQTEHNQRLILNPEFKGATQDLLEIESENLRKQQEAERKAEELERRREAARRKAEEDERQRLVAPSSTSSSRGLARGTRSRGRVYSRGSGIGRGGSTSGSMSDTSTSSLQRTRSGSGIGRGFGGTRGTRGRGVR